MKKIFTIRVRPSEAGDPAFIKKLLAAEAGVQVGEISGYNLLKKSIDARSKQVLINITLEAYIGEPWLRRVTEHFTFRDVTQVEKRVIIIGAGPAGLFAALRLLEKGIKPIILERGKDVRARRRDLAILNKDGIINPESNYCFGEGGAGTYSDGKLYTRSTKRGDTGRVLNLLVRFGAGEHILYDAHPHIGTNKLPGIISAIRQEVTACGGEFLFEKKVIDFFVENENIKTVITADGDRFSGLAVILATGHSARDIFHLLHRKKIRFEFKPFAMGVRIEHPQELIDSIQYHCPLISDKGTPNRDPFLPPAAYSLAEQVNGKGVFSFCMCPGGIIAPAATSPGELVVNGWSPSKRNNPYANSGMVVAVDEKDTVKFHDHGVLSGILMQEETEKRAYHSGGGKFVAPAQRMTDFCDKKLSGSLPSCSYLPGIRSVGLYEVLPSFIYEGLSTAFRLFGKKMKGYYTSEALVVATESRTSSPVRIPRDKTKLNHPQIMNLYPCGEGAGYAGGIVSAAIDGENTASMIIKKLNGEM